MASGVICLDTHIVVWLHARELSRFSDSTARVLDEENLVISPMVELEITCLHEIGRVTVTGSAMISDLRGRLGLDTSAHDVASLVTAAEDLDWTRDPFDRLIVADAGLTGSRLITKDRTIRRHYPLAEW